MNSRELESSAYNFKMTQIFNLKTGRVEESDYWLSQGDEVIHKLRYSLREDRKGYGCPFCKTPVILKMGSKRKAHFAHTKRPEGVKCAICEENDMTDEDRVWQKYNQPKETDEHIRLKKLIWSTLLNDPNARNVKIEKNKRGSVTPTRWKRPDVQCLYNGKELVFEVQISKTWISDIVEREVFYKTNGAFIIWVFNDFNISAPGLDITQADIFYNNPEVNLFVLDKEAEERIDKTGELSLNCYYKKSKADTRTNSIVDSWTNSLIGLSNIQYDQTSKKPFYYNYTYEKTKLITELKEHKIKIRKGINNKFEEDRKRNFKAIDEITNIEKKKFKNDKEVSKTNYSPVKIEDDVSKKYEEISNKGLVDLIFEFHLSKNINNLNNRIFDLKLLGFELPDNLIEILVEKNLIKRLHEVTSQIQYQRIK